MEKQPKLPHKLSTKTTMNKLIDEMEKGKESTQILRNILEQRQRLNSNDDGQDFFKALDHHSMVALTSCITSLSLMRGFEVDGSRIGKRKMDHLDDNGSLNGGFKHEDLCGEVSNNNTPIGKDGRGSYKRRKIGEGREEVVSQLREDGFGWRKYGQKVILNSKYPRNYYRCTHKFDKKCQATKQVQQISENPAKYRVIYHGNHICNYNILNKSPIIIDDDSPEEHSSTIVLSFAQKNQFDPLLFPTSTTGAVKQECNSSPSVQSTYEDQRATTTGLSSTTLVSEQSDLVSTAENFCQTEVEDDYSCMWTDLGPLHDDLFAYY